eukprot:8931551-Pyramimonas_sp.AAC.1
MVPSLRADLNPGPQWQPCCQVPVQVPPPLHFGRLPSTQYNKDRLPQTRAKRNGCLVPSRLDARGCGGGYTGSSAQT